ncbi:MAG: FtsW/RodA/SpoVE family cell cycle protein [Acutalibacteraceae bacterium]|nr:FtsW/RodA/SpoVE family cell cycle protein [Acutalibacteraceae bacterium]
MDFLAIFNLPYLGIVVDFALLVIRILLPILAVIIVFQCFSSMRRHRREENALIMLLNKSTGESKPVLYWENSLGRSKSSDIIIEDPTVSREHAVLLRRKEGWFVNDVGSKSGTFVNGNLTEGRTALRVDDVIKMGESEYVVKRTDDVIVDGHSWFFNRPKNKASIKPSMLMLLISVFLFFLAVEASLCDEVQDFEPFLVWGVFTAVSWIFYNVSTKLIKRVNFELESLAIFMSGTGVMMLVRQEFRQSIVQTIAMVGGMICFCIIIKFIEDPDRVEKVRYPFYVLAVLFLVVNLLFARVTNGAANWISIGGISVQPSEFVKVIYILVSASALDRLLTKGNLLQFIVFSVICVGALILMSDLGTALIFFCTFLFIAFMRSGDFKTVVLAIVAAVLGASFVLSFKPYIADRFSAWGKCFELADSTGYQQARVLTYSASGGLIGVGVGNGYLKYVFASESDLVFGLLCEELGLIIAVCMVVCIIGLVIYARAITTRSRSTFYSISACCAAGLMLVQTALNVFGATDILPLTGVTLPFVSLGGSSMISCWCLLAFIKAADERTYAVKKNKKKS